MKIHWITWVFAILSIIMTHYSIYYLKVNCMKKIIALIAMLSVAFLASCSKEEIKNEAANVEAAVETVMENEVPMEDIVVAGEEAIENAVEEMTDAVEEIADATEEAIEATQEAVETVEETTTPAVEVKDTKGNVVDDEAAAVLEADPTVEEIIWRCKHR